jgi:hypothetical protein
MCSKESNTTYNTFHEQSRNSNEKINKNVIILLMRGVVGSGKTTFATKLNQKLTEHGIKCIVQGTDQYCKNGLSMQNAIQCSKDILNTVNGTEQTVVIIDTCGEQVNYNNIFGINFNNATKLNYFPNYEKTKQNEYLSWSLHNLLSRKSSGQSENFWITPCSVGNSKCIEILNKKAKKLFGKRVEKFALNIDINHVKDNYNNYQTYLNNNMDLNEQINKIFKKIIG